MAPQDKTIIIQALGEMLNQRSKEAQSQAVQTENVNKKIVSSESMLAEKLKADSLNTATNAALQELLNKEKIKADSTNLGTRLTHADSLHDEKLAHDLDVLSKKITADSTNLNTQLEAASRNLEKQISSDASINQAKLDHMSGISANEIALERELSSEQISSREGINAANIASEEKRQKNELFYDLAGQQTQIMTVLNQAETAKEQARWNLLHEKMSRVKEAKQDAKVWSPNVNDIYQRSGDFFTEMKNPFIEDDMLKGYGSVRSLDENSREGIAEHVHQAKLLPENNPKRKAVLKMLDRFIERSKHPEFQDGTTIFGDDPTGDRAKAVQQELENWKQELLNYDIHADYGISEEDRLWYNNWDRGAQRNQNVINAIIQQMNATTAKIHP